MAGVRNWITVCVPSRANSHCAGSIILLFLLLLPWLQTQGFVFQSFSADNHFFPSHFLFGPSPPYMFLALVLSSYSVYLRVFLIPHGKSKLFPFYLHLHICKCWFLSRYDSIHLSVCLSIYLYVCLLISSFCSYISQEISSLFLFIFVYYLSTSLSLLYYVSGGVLVV